MLCNGRSGRVYRTKMITRAIKDTFCANLLSVLRNNDLFVFKRYRSMFVPKSKAVENHHLDIIRNFLQNNKTITVLTGAGVSTESGIPDYRSEEVGMYARSNHTPIRYQEFLRNSDRRQRYWARNFVAWPQFSSFQPNTVHYVLSSWEKSGQLHWLITQNVDALHSKAGTKRLTELHGCSHRVECLSCHMKMPRTEMQVLLTNLNPDWHAESIDIAPDGDVQLDDELVQTFQIPPCPNCGGLLKPEVVFFGDNVEKSKVDFVYDKISESDALLILGTSLQVYSSYRILLAAHKQKKQIGAINIGPIRGGHYLDFHIKAKCGDLFLLLG
ncbi:NAD-dependent protein lipoamidase sirtuin-4, mitochondrial-like [Octopus vulgaris]|uniref:NAD-dependent protein lipoamidase sirtuin-4, mitochondrial-like n=1 Tax=Octopus vulgaris TaxID=6645 RepID=A0AA36B5Q6_OCTVU|nr:NAD-dependent protein lipoamidase sirtuin-4, mitochondrial-like [Octopus vulgaris]